MKKFILLLGIVLFFFAPVSAQFQICPQLGFNLTRTTASPRSGIDTKGAYGFSLAVDFKIGKRFYVQPGGYFATLRTIYIVNDSLIADRNSIDRYAAGIRAWAGYKIINEENFKLRFALGPSYDFFLGTNVHDDIYFSQDDFNKGSFNLDANLGIDIWRISLDVAYSVGLSKTFDADYFSRKPKYQRLTTTVGFIIGRRSPKSI